MSLKREFEQSELEKRLFAYIGDSNRTDLVFRRDRLSANYEALKENYFNDLRELVEKYGKENYKEETKAD